MDGRHCERAVKAEARVRGAAGAEKAGVFITARMLRLQAGCDEEKKTVRRDRKLKDEEWFVPIAQRLKCWRRRGVLSPWVLLRNRWRGAHRAFVQ